MKTWVAIAFLILTIYTAKNTVTLGWDQDGIGVDHYEVQLIRDVSGTVYAYGTLATTITILKPKSGVFTAQVRACGDPPCSKSSDWCPSTSESCAQPGPFKIQFKPSAPVFMIGPH